MYTFMYYVYIHSPQIAHLTLRQEHFRVGVIIYNSVFFMSWQVRETILKHLVISIKAYTIDRIHT